MFPLCNTRYPRPLSASSSPPNPEMRIIYWDGKKCFEANRLLNVLNWKVVLFINNRDVCFVCVCVCVYCSGMLHRTQNKALVVEHALKQSL